MKKLITSFFFACLSVVLFAQNIGNQYYVIQLKDKGAVSKTAFVPQKYLTPQAIERRLNHQIGFDEYDIPVYNHYVEDISNHGAKVLARSRWLNSVVVQTSPEKIKIIAGSDYVKSIKKLDNQQYASSKLDHDISGEPVLQNGTLKHSATNLYDYGNAAAQVAQINLISLHNQGYDGRGMTIAVIDAGFNSVDLLTCFDSLRATNRILGTRDFAEPGNNVYATTMHSHGTAVLSTMAANAPGQMVGMAPQAKYWLLRSEVGSSESIVEEYYWVSAAEFADSVGVDLINSSLGYTTFDDPLTSHTYADMDGNTAVCTIGADRAAAKGILVVNSAGNDGNVAWNYIGAPADGDSVFTIGAVNSSGFRASFSSKGPTYDGRIKPTVDAMGSGTTVWYPGGLTSGSGTSFSSPIICGATACIWQALPSLNNMQIIDLLKMSGSQYTNPDNMLGWGIPDYAKALSTAAVLKPNPDSGLQIFPNPCKNKINIVLPKTLRTNGNIRVCNLQGKCIKEIAIPGSGNKVLVIDDLVGLPSGMYIVHISDLEIAYSALFVKM